MICFLLSMQCCNQYHNVPDCVMKLIRAEMGLYISVLVGGSLYGRDWYILCDGSSR